MGDVKKVPYCGSKHIKRHGRNFSHPGAVAPWICAHLIQEPYNFVNYAFQSLKVNIQQNKVHRNLFSKTTLQRNVTIILQLFLFSLKMSCTEDEAIKMAFVKSITKNVITQIT